METNEVVYASWYYSDRWGSREEEGCTLHKDLTDFEQYVKNYHDSFTNELNMGSYFVPRKPKQVLVVKEIYDKVLSSNFGLNISFEEEQKLVKDKNIIL